MLSLRRTYLPFLIVTMAAVAGVPVPFLSVSAFRLAILVVNAVVWSLAILALQSYIRSMRAAKTETPEEVSMEEGS